MSLGVVQPLTSMTPKKCMVSTLGTVIPMTIIESRKLSWIWTMWSELNNTQAHIELLMWLLIQKPSPSH